MTFADIITPDDQAEIENAIAWIKWYLIFGATFAGVLVNEVVARCACCNHEGHDYWSCPALPVGR